MKPYYKRMQIENKSRQSSDCMDIFIYLFVYLNGVNFRKKMGQYRNKEYF